MRENRDRRFSSRFSSIATTNKPNESSTGKQASKQAREAKVEEAGNKANKGELFAKLSPIWPPPISSRQYMYIGDSELATGQLDDSTTRRLANLATPPSSH